MTPSPPLDAPQGRDEANRRRPAGAEFFYSLLEHISTIIHTECRRTDAPDDEPGWVMTTPPDTLARRALDLLKVS